MKKAAPGRPAQDGCFRRLLCLTALLLLLFFYLADVQEVLLPSFPDDQDQIDEDN
jgi:hypothetical protein